MTAVSAEAVLFDRILENEENVPFSDDRGERIGEEGTAIGTLDSTQDLLRVCGVTVFLKGDAVALMGRLRNFRTKAV